MKLSQAHIHFNAQGTPVAEAFDDVYFSNASGLEESRYVFLGQNHCIRRWQANEQTTFTIAETGFGTGLNFLVTWQAFDAFLREHPDSLTRRLHFISTEKYPISHRDLGQALAQWQTLSSYSDALLAQYPAPVPGCHRLVFNQGAVILDLHLGDVLDSLETLENAPTGLVDCWYLDGFAPSKNPDMWTTALFRQMARLSRKHASVATFTAAGFVRRGLIDAGFSISKVKGFGHKREMLAGRLSDRPLPQHNGPWQRLKGARSQRVTIIGAGLAGANLALSLAQRGIDTDIYFANSHPGGGASGNLQGGFYPQLNAQHNAASLIQALGFGFARRRYDALLENGHGFDHQWCGVLQLAFNDNTLKRYGNMLDKQLWPPELVSWLDPEQCSERAGIALDCPGLWHPKGGWINPPGLVHALLAAAEQQADCALHPAHQLVRMEQHNGRWRLDFANGHTALVDNLVLATGGQTPAFDCLQSLPLRRVRGQVDKIAPTPDSQRLATVLCHKGYFCPEYQGQQALGSTYIKGDTATEVRLAESEVNLNMQRQALAGQAWPQALASTGGRAAVRLTTPDHLPLVGAMPAIAAQQRDYQDWYLANPAETYPEASNLDGLFLLLGLGSRGLTHAPLLAEALACQISGQPLPLAGAVLNALNPNRYMLRYLSSAPKDRPSNPF